jgi:hypothetical protein
MSLPTGQPATTTTSKEYTQSLPHSVNIHAVALAEQGPGWQRRVRSSDSGRRRGRRKRAGHVCEERRAERACRRHVRTVKHERAAQRWLQRCGHAERERATGSDSGRGRGGGGGQGRTGTRRACREWSESSNACNGPAIRRERQHGRVAVPGRRGLELRKKMHR